MHSWVNLQLCSSVLKPNTIIELLILSLMRTFQTLTRRCYRLSRPNSETQGRTTHNSNSLITVTCITIKNNRMVLLTRFFVSFSMKFLNHGVVRAFSPFMAVAILYIPQKNLIGNRLWSGAIEVVEPWPR